MANALFGAIVGYHTVAFGLDITLNWRLVLSTNSRWITWCHLKTIIPIRLAKIEKFKLQNENTLLHDMFKFYFKKPLYLLQIVHFLCNINNILLTNEGYSRDYLRLVALRKRITMIINFFKKPSVRSFLTTE